VSLPTAPSATKLAPATDMAAGVASLILAALLEGLFLIAPLAIASRQLGRGASWRARLAALGLRKTALGPALIVTIIGLVLGIGGSALYSVIINYLQIPLQNNSDALLAMGRSAPYTVLGLLVGAALVAPVCEEIFFRGFAFPGLLNAMSALAAALLSSALFAIAHTDLGSLVPLFVIGLVLAWARWRTNSLWPGIIIHMANNTLAAVTIIPLIFK
jgi:uncharacterized protein